MPESTRQIKETYREREIAPIEYEVPSSKDHLGYYIGQLWGPEFYSQYGITNFDQMLYRFKIDILTKMRKDGAVLDIGSGDSTAMTELQDAIEQIGGFLIKCVSLDLKETILRKVGGFRIVADALELPIKSKSTQVVLSKGLVPFLLEETGRTTLINLANKGWSSSSIAQKKELLWKGELQYDLRLLQTFFTEIKRVLQPNSVARIYPLDIQSLVRHRQPKYNRERIKNFMGLMKDFVQVGGSARYYEDTVSLHKSENVDPDSVTALIRTVKVALSKRDFIEFSRIFTPDKWESLIGVLVLKN